MLLICKQLDLGGVTVQGLGYGAPLDVSSIALNQACSA